MQEEGIPNFIVFIVAAAVLGMFILTAAIVGVILMLAS